MDLSSLYLIHLSKKNPHSPKIVKELLTTHPQLQAVFYIESCLRHVWVFHQPIQLSVDQVELLSGEQAYRFLLETACGLNSAVLGETEIFGQLKEAWKRYEHSAVNSDLIQDLTPWIQKLFEDVKEARTEYIQNLGSQNYGSLCRKLINMDSTQPILLIGAGQLTYSIAPYCTNRPLWLLNRNQEKLFPLMNSLKSKKPRAKIEVLSFSEERFAWKVAEDIIICTPYNKSIDTYIPTAKNKTGKIIHFGLESKQDTPWKDLPSFYSLNDFFKLNTNEQKMRKQKISHALNFCKERSQLRSMGRSISVPHGWEDLASFV